MATNKTDKIDTMLSNLKTMSAKIRLLESQGMTRGAIAKKLGIKYQWVRNVLEQKVTTPKERIDQI